MPHIHFRDLKITSVTSSSGVFSGRNVHNGWWSSHKASDGNGTVTGNQNVFAEGRYAVFNGNDTDEPEGKE
ncbi:MAG TPA: hypothetical protein VFK33_02115 [Bacillales bacterium]|nr:hypothetical protein [Bacillales bacterium]